MRIRQKSHSRFAKKARRGFRGYPLATLAFYGPDNKRASKVAVGIVPDESGEVTELRRWYSDAGDVRSDRSIGESIDQFLKSHEVRSVTGIDGIIGCPHEEGKDYPEGETCPRCPYWRGRNRFTGEIEPS